MSFYGIKGQLQGLKPWPTLGGLNPPLISGKVFRYNKKYSNDQDLY